MKEIQWLLQIKKDILNFVNHQKSENSGYFKFTYGGDIYQNNNNWGLGASIFAAKILYILDEIENLNQQYQYVWIKFIKKFQIQKTGEFIDPLILKKASLINKISAVKNCNFSNFFGEQYKRAETRRVWEGLFFLGDKPDRLYIKIPKNVEQIKKYFKKLNWNNPWGASSHINHLLFFSFNSKKLFRVDNDHLIKFILDYLNQYQSKKSGSWHLNENISNREKINSAMKICMGFHSIKKYDIPYPEKLIDLCLAEKNLKNGCDNLNQLYVLYFCLKNTDYRRNEINKYAMDNILFYKKFYHERQGGFSFYIKKSQTNYYGARISKGLNEPDLHGTSMFLWALSLICEILNINKEVGFILPINNY